jgi:type IV pilus assembly protein PilQ
MIRRITTISLLTFLPSFLFGQTTAPATQALVEAPTTQPAPSLPPAGTVAISNTGTVELHVTEANLNEVLRMLSLQSQRNIIASKEVKGTVSANLYNVTIQEALDALLRANGYAYRERGNFIYVYSTKELADLDRSERKTHTEIFRLYYTPVTNILPMIKPVLSSDGQVASSAPASSGIDTGTKDLGGDTHAGEDILVITDYPENLEQIGKVIKEVDRRPQQILIEATILRAALTENNALGVDFTLLGGVNFKALGDAGSNAASALGGQILDSGGKQGAITHNGFSGAQTGFTQNVPQGGLRVGVVTNNIAMFLSALEAVTDTTVLANPKILALNKQKGEVIVGRKDGYLTSTVTQTSTVQSVDFLDTGTRLIFRPYVGEDGYIRMEIHPEDSSGGLTAANLPFKITTELTSNIMVKDGHTIVIGGMFRESSTTSRSQIPGLGNLPGLGYLFRSQADETQREEIIVLLTPHLIKDDVSYAAASEASMKDAQRLQVGVRRGMMPFGRERLAESWYEAAVTEMDKPLPNRDRALWYLNCATNLNPTFLEAIKMREQLSGKIFTESNNSTIYGFVRRRTIAERGIQSTTRPAALDIGVTPTNAGDAAPRTAAPTSGNSSTPASDIAAEKASLEKSGLPPELRAALNSN